MSFQHTSAIVVMACGLMLAVAGCGSPSAANIALRKQVQRRDDTIAQLMRQHTADQADITTHAGPTTTALSQAQLSNLYTVHGLKLGRLTGENLNDNGPGPAGVKVQATPTDDDGESLKAAGSFDVSMFDLNDKGQRVGQWTFDNAAARTHWYGSTLLYSYVLPCPWQQAPPHPDLTLRVTFSDLLTGREFTEQKQIHVQLPATTAPAVSASTQP